MISVFASVQTWINIRLRCRIDSLLEDMYGINTPLAENLREVEGNFQIAKLRIEELHDEQVIMLQRLDTFDEQVDRLERYIISDFHEQTTEQTRLADGTIPFDGEARRLDD